MKSLFEFIFVFSLSTLFIINPITNNLLYSTQSKSKNLQITDSQFSTFLYTFRDVVETYINELEKEGVKINRSKIEKELDKLSSVRGPITINESELNNYIVNKKEELEKTLTAMQSEASINQNQLKELLGKFLAQTDEANEVGEVNSGAPGQIDNVVNTLGRVFGGLFEGFLFGGPLGAGLGVALGLAVDAGLSMSVILGIAVIAGVILAVIVGIGALPAGIIIGALIGAIIGALLFAVVAAFIFGVGTFFVVTLFLIILPIINIILAFAAAVVVGVIIAFLAAIVGGIIGLVGGGILGLISVPVAAVIGGVAGGLSGGLFGAVVSGAGQIILIPLALFLGAIGFVLGLVGGPIAGGAVGFLNTPGMTLFSTTIKTIESYGDNYLYNIDNIVKTTLNEAKKVLGPKSYNKIKLVEIIVDTADFTTAEGINKATEEVLSLVPSLAK